jgi:hypothetical protein
MTCLDLINITVPDVVPDVALRRFEEPQYTPIGVPAGIQKQYLPNKSHGSVTTWAKFLGHKDRYILKKVDCFPSYLLPKRDFNCSHILISHIHYHYEYFTHFLFLLSLKYSSVALQPFIGPWPLFQFLNPIHSR